MFPENLVSGAFRSANGEYGWTREQVPEVVSVLCLHGCALLGGEVWWLRHGSADAVGWIPQRVGPDGIYAWESTRLPGESWTEFATRAAAETLAYVRSWPEPEDLRPDLPGIILYNLTWDSCDERD
jgi:hypothetical protein